MSVETVSNKHFTLIELLVVISIIAILTSILLPVLQDAREKGRQAVCKSNIKQIFIAINLYADDNKGTLAQSRYVLKTRETYISNSCNALCSKP